MSLHSITPAYHLAAMNALTPSERPAAELPEYEPTAAELAALEFATDDQLDDHLAHITTLCAIEQHHRDLLAAALGTDLEFAGEVPLRDVEEGSADSELSLTGRCAA